VEIRSAAVADAARIGEINVTAWRAAYRGLIPDKVLDAMSVQHRTEIWRALIAQGVAVIVAVVDQTIAGYAGFGPNRDDDVASHVGELYALYLDPDRWGQGIGHALHDAVLLALSGAGYTKVTLWVLDTNERAISFYERHGWVPGEVKDELRGDIVLHEVRYARQLEPL
jgi:GNAT superfamily N-acetyltransferase